MEFTFKVLDSEGSDEFIRFIETLDFVEPVKSAKQNGNTKKRLRTKKNPNIIPAKNPNGNPLMLTGAFDHIKDIKKWRESLWRRE